MTAVDIAQELAKKYDLQSKTQQKVEKLVKIFLSHGIMSTTTHKLLDEIIELLEII